MNRAQSGIADDQAAQWVARMDADEWSAELEAGLQSWLNSDPHHAGALLQAQAAWMALDRDEEAQTASPDEDGGEAEAQEWAPDALPLSGWRRRSVLLGGAGTIAASVAGGLLWWNMGTAYSTATGEIRRVPLDDGSVVAINSGSEVQVRFEPVQRNVRLNHGEAWFQVAKNPDRPFVVTAGSVIVRAVGTAFSVRRAEGGAEILVTDGIVEAWAGQADGHKVRLVAGQRAFVGDNSAIVVPPSTASSIDRSLAWRSGMIDLAGETLADAIGQFNRYNARKLVLADPALAEEQFDGLFKIDDPEGFASAVQAGLQIPVDASDPKRISLGAAQ